MYKQLNTWPQLCLLEIPQGNNHTQWMHGKYSWCLLWPRLLVISFQTVHLHHHPKTKQDLLWYSQILPPYCSLKHPWKINREGYKPSYSISSSSISLSPPKPTEQNHSKVDNWCWIIPHLHNPSRMDKTAQKSVIAFDIAQFFPFLNHRIMTDIIKLASFDGKVVTFLKNYLTNRVTTYRWNHSSSPPFPASVGVGQGSALSLVLSVLYPASILHLFEQQARCPENPLNVSTLSFVDNGLLISQERDYDKSLSTLKRSYNVISHLFTAVGLLLEYKKSEIFHFSRARIDLNPPLDLTDIGGPILYPKDTWRYLGFYFNRRLTFRYHTHFYANKALSTVKAMNMLGNLLRGLLPLQKRLLYHTCVLPIVLYGFQLWFFKGAPTYFPLQNLQKMQRWAALWITGAFCNLPNIWHRGNSGPHANPPTPQEAT